MKISPHVAEARDFAISQAKNLPQLIAFLSAADPKLADAIKGKSLIASKSPWGTLAVTVVSWAAAHWGLGWSDDTCNLVAGAGVVLGSYAMRYITRAQITGFVKPTPPATSSNTGA